MNTGTIVYNRAMETTRTTRPHIRFELAMIVVLCIPWKREKFLDKRNSEYGRNES